MTGKSSRLAQVAEAHLGGLQHTDTVAHCAGILQGLDRESGADASAAPPPRKRQEVDTGTPFGYPR